MKRGRILWLVYKRLRIGLAFLGFVLMYGIYTGNLNWLTISIGIGVFSVEIFGAAYNDYVDFEEDIRNKRHDKWTVSGLLSRKRMKHFSLLMLSLGLIFLWIPGLLSQGIYYAFMMWAYSYGKIRLKKYNITGYLIMGSSWIFLPVSMMILFSRSLISFDLFFVLFFFFQYVYLLSQKDSTDPKDETNLFLARGWGKSLTICTLLSALSSLSLLIICLSSVLLIPVWLVNSLIKTLHFKMVSQNKITREKRGGYVLIEILSPYLYLGGAILA